MTTGRSWPEKRALIEHLLEQHGRRIESTSYIGMQELRDIHKVLFPTCSWRGAAVVA
jgi:hypothetical protein